jgi:hypothetical protein
VNKPYHTPDVNDLDEHFLSGGAKFAQPIVVQRTNMTRCRKFKVCAAKMAFAIRLPPFGL